MRSVTAHLHRERSNPLYDTLLYGVEVKFYSARLKLTKELESERSGFFAIGDGAGITRGLAQAGASGVQAARAIVKRL